MRPKKTRHIKCLPEESCFSPRGKSSKGAECICLSIDEFEAIRLADLEELTHAKAAKIMKISRPTFTRILSSAHKKIADGFVNGKTMNIEGGCCQIGKKL